MAVESLVKTQAARRLKRRRWPPQGQWTYEDWLRLPNDGWQYEVIEGVLYMVPAPTTTHQRSSNELGFLINVYARQKQLGVIFSAPTDVYLPGHRTPVEPDLLFIAAGREGIIKERGIEGAPDLVVEICSVHTWWRDVKVKLPLYQNTGVRECWIVDPDRDSIEVRVLREGQYTLLGHWVPGEHARSEVLEGFTVAVDEVLGA